MSHERLIVLKFGGSVLQEPTDVHRVVQEIYRWRRNGYQVVAVVSAIGNTTNELTRLSRDFGENIEPQKTAMLLATGELQSASLLGLALDRAGIGSFVCDESAIGLQTTGKALDASLIDLDVALLRSKLDERGCVVLPGFIGRGKSGELTLLGRGGSDLTALFVAAKLGAWRCRLIKDVDGLYEFDPKLQSRSPRRYQLVSFDDALQLDESIVQHKAIRFAKSVGLSFEVSAFLSAQPATEVGDFAQSVLTCRTYHDHEIENQQRLKVAILGLGTVGFGVYQQLTEWFQEDFEIVAVAVKDWRKAIRNGIPVELIVTAEEAINSSCDVVVELVGGTELPRRWITNALNSGKHVVTANKSLLSRDITRLEKLALANGVRIPGSAAVGGSLPALETVRRLSRRERVIEVSGVLNGSTNFVLDAAANGKSFSEAVAIAQETGLTEQDARFDLHGIDAAEKLVLLAGAAGYQLNFNDVVRHELNAELVDEFQGAAGETLRQVASWRLLEGVVTASVTVRAVAADSMYADVRSAENLVEIKTASGKRTSLRGLGAGRWPTSAAVLADLWELVTDHQYPPAESRISELIVR